MKNDLWAETIPIRTNARLWSAAMKFIIEFTFLLNVRVTLDMRMVMITLAMGLSVSLVRAENEYAFPDYDSNKTCNEVFAESGTYPSKTLLKICLHSEQRNYNMSRTAWEYLSTQSAQYCSSRVQDSIQKARKNHKFRYAGLVDPYTELWICVDKKMHDEAAQDRPKPVEKW